MSTLGIIVAMREELDVVLARLQDTRTHQRAGMTFHCGNYLGKSVVAVVCGVGKVNAATCTQLLISEFSVNRLINIGIAGGLGPGIVPGDIVIADTLVQHDMDLQALGLPPGQLFRLDTFDFPADPALFQLALDAARHIQNHQVHVGRIVTGDQFIACQQKTQWLTQTFGALACEMESAAIAQVCYLNALPFVCIRSISDNANQGAHMDFDTFLPIAVNNASALLHAMVPAC
ncbi:MAG TPA: 5'-methylthioadenosine/adenosylhomocysteine nucleosidase [Alcaligenes sp.]|nr:5'-methylthioadenosine/adenosylhomocysteine nucleosidase [Alcaligenes sp.]HRL28500.1 5'-methylthioadenosine/adenosylhomocysteine nucleosidase [Alcaligenes sp.]